MPKFAMIDDKTKLVVNIFPNPVDAEGFTLIRDNDWAEPEAEVYSGMKWANAPERPAVFAWPDATEEGEPQTLAEAKAARDKAMTDLQSANAAVDRLLSQ